MRPSGYICRPCLALIRNRQAHALNVTNKTLKTQPWALPRTTLPIPRSRSIIPAVSYLHTTSTVATSAAAPTQPTEPQISDQDQDDQDAWPDSTDPFDDEMSYEDFIRAADAEWDSLEDGLLSEHGVLPEEGVFPKNKTKKTNVVTNKFFERRKNKDVEPKLLEYDEISPETEKQWNKLHQAVIAYEQAEPKVKLKNSETLHVYLTTLENDEHLSQEKREHEKKQRIRWDFWFRNFKDMGLPSETAEDQVKALRTGTHGIQLKQLLRYDENVEDMRERWQKLSPHKRDQRWPSVMSKCLRYAHHRLPQILEATFEQGISRHYIVRDVLDYLAEQKRYVSKNEQQAYADSLVDTLLYVLRNSKPGYMELKQNTIFNIIKLASVKKVSELYVGFGNSGQRILFHTKLQFASRFAKDGECRPLALDLLTELVRVDGLDINSTLGNALASSLLSIPNRDPGRVPDKIRATLPPALRVQIYETLLDLGLNPNIINFTAIMQNLCESRELPTAWDIYNLMLSQGIELDDWVYLVLLRGSKNIEDHVSAHRVIAKVKEKGIHNPTIWNEALHTLFVTALTYTQKRNIKPPRVVPVFPMMLVGYSKLFDTAPLQKFMTTDIKDHFSGLPAGGFGMGVSGGPLWGWVKSVWPIVASMPTGYPTLQPGMDTLYIMLLGYVKGFSKPYSIVAFYSHFRNLLKAGDPLACQFVKEKGPMLHNVVMKALCEYHPMLRVGLDVLSDMLKDTIEESEQADQSPDAPPRHPAPNIYTWSILLNGFMFHKQFKQGERILAMMREHGIQPNTATWNQLLGGYTRTQQASKAVGVLQRMEREGCVPDAFTTRAFSYLTNQEGALKMMEVMAERRKKLVGGQETALGRLYAGGVDGPKGAVDEYRKLEAEVHEFGEELKAKGWEPLEGKRIQRLSREVKGVWSVKSI